MRKLRKGFSVGAALVGLLGAAPATGQMSADTARDTMEQQRSRERDAQLRERSLQARELRPDEVSSPLIQRLPENESPCFRIRQIGLRGEQAHRFGWVIDQLAGSDGLDGPLRRCLGATGIGIVLQRAQSALLVRGYVTSRVLIEPQDLSQGELALTLLPGRIRHVRFTDPVSERATAWNAVPARPGDVLNLRDIEQALENFKRVPTAEADIQIVPADEPGRSDLLIRWMQSRPVRLSLSADDSGSHSTGRYQGSATLSLDNPLALNDLFYVGVQRDLGGGDAGSRGTRGHSLHYSVPLGRHLLALDAHQHRYFQSVAGLTQDYIYRGTSGSQTLTLSRLLHRAAAHKTTLHLQAFARQSRNFIDDTEVEVQRRRVGGWQLGVGHRAFLGDGTLNLALNYRRGTGAFGSLPAPEEAFGEGASRFALVQADARWQWPFQLGTQAWHYSGQWRAQLHRTPLTPQDRFAIGGRHTVRGFDGESSLSAESGWTWRNELSTPLGQSGQAFFIALDHGQVRGPSARWLAGTRLSGAALGLRGAVGALQYEVFSGWPLHRPDGFRTASMTAGFWLAAGF